MGGFERGRDSYVPEVKDKPSVGIMTPSEPNNEEDNKLGESECLSKLVGIFWSIKCPNRLSIETIKTLKRLP